MNDGNGFTLWSRDKRGAWFPVCTAATERALFPFTGGEWVILPAGHEPDGADARPGREAPAVAGPSGG